MFDALLEHAKNLPDRPDADDITARIAAESPEPGVALAIQGYVNITQKQRNTPELELAPTPNLDPLIGTEDYVDYLITMWILDRDPKYLIGLMRQCESADKAISEYAWHIHEWMKNSSAPYKEAAGPGLMALLSKPESPRIH